MSVVASVLPGHVPWQCGLGWTLSLLQTFFSPCSRPSWGWIGSAKPIPEMGEPAPWSCTCRRCRSLRNPGWCARGVTVPVPTDLRQGLCQACAATTAMRISEHTSMRDVCNSFPSVYSTVSSLLVLPLLASHDDHAPFNLRRTQNFRT